MTRRWAVFAGAMGTVAAIAFGADRGGFHFNHTESGPLGLLRADPRGEPRVGATVRFCMPAEVARHVAGRPYAGGAAGGPCPADTWMLVKPLIAGPGDTVVHLAGRLAINGCEIPQSATRPRDTDGRPVPHPPFGTTVLKPGEFWAYSPYADNSFDSRYVGPVVRSQMRGTIQGVATWTTAKQKRSLSMRLRSPSSTCLAARLGPGLL